MRKIGGPLSAVAAGAIAVRLRGQIGGRMRARPYLGGRCCSSAAVFVEICQRARGVEPQRLAGGGQCGVVGGGLPAGIATPMQELAVSGVAEIVVCVTPLTASSCIG